MTTRYFLYAPIIGFLLLAGFAHAAISEIDRPAPDITLYATPATATAGQSVRLTWTTRFATSCTATGGSGTWAGAKERNGQRSVAPTVTTTYTLVCSGRGGSASASVVVTVSEVTPPPPPSVTPTTTPPTTTTTTPPVVTPPVTPTTTPPTTTPTTTPPTPPTTPTTTPPVAICPPVSAPACGAGMYPTLGAVTAAGCIQSSVCTLAIVPSVPQVLPVPTGAAYVAGGEYAGASFAGSNAAAVYAGATGSTSIAYVTTSLDARKVWWLSGKIGLSPLKAATTTTPTTTPPTGGGKRPGGNIQGASYGGSVRVSIVASAATIDPTDPLSETLYTTVLTPTAGLQNIKIPLGVWGMRPNLKLTVSVQKTANDSLTYGAVVDGLSLYSYGDRPDQGIVNNDPEWKSADQQNKQITALSSFAVSWIHDSIRTTGASWTQAPLLKRVQDQGKKIQLVVGPLEEDYTEGAAARVPNNSEWGYALPLSKINLDLYEKRLRNNLTSYKNAGVDVKAVEVGNEFDLIAFNGDIPLNRAPTDADYQLFAQSYARFLERTVSIVKRPEFYPNAKIILGSPAIDWSPALGKLEPGKMYTPLKNLNGKNYLALVDGIGIHYYPADNEDGSQSVARTKAYLTTLGVLDRPLWVSEWGFYNNRFPNASGKDRYRAFVDLYDKILRADFKVIFMTNFALDEFNFPFHLVNASYQKLPEARFFDHYPSPVPSAVVAERSITDSTTACVGCGLSGWFDEVWADVRDFVLRMIKS